LDKIKKKIAKGNSVFLGVPLQLGINNINPEYLESIKEIFSFPQNVGIAGGRGGGSFYFSGIINAHLDKDPHLIYLDPHVT
jgi:cysteine protease ATG4